MASAADDTAIEKQNWHWRNTARPVRFFNMDARAATPFLLLLVYARPITLLLCVICVLIFRFVENRGLTFPSAMRALRVWLFGFERDGHYAFRFRTLKDYG